MNKATQNKAKRTRWLGIWLFLVCAMCCAACSKTVIGNYGGNQPVSVAQQKAPAKYKPAPTLQASGKASAQAGQTQAARTGAKARPAALPVLQASSQPAKQLAKNTAKQQAKQPAKAAISQPARKPAQTASSRQVSRGKATAVRGDAVCRTVRGQMGIRYKYGGSSPKTGFDCSGLLVWAYKQHGVTLPRTAKAQAGAGSSVQRNKLSPGDIVVFKIKSGYHTGLYTGNNKFIHSPRTGSTVREDKLDNSYWKKAYVGARRVI